MSIRRRIAWVAVFVSVAIGALGFIVFILGVLIELADGITQPLDDYISPVMQMSLAGLCLSATMILLGFLLVGILLARQSRHYGAGYGEAYRLIQRMQFPQAIQLLERVLAGGKVTPDLLMLLTSAYAYNGQLAKAQETADRAVQLFPGDAGAYMTLANGYRMQASYGEAAIAFQTAAQLSPTQPIIWAELGFVQQLSGEHDSAIESFKHAALFSMPSMYAVRVNFLPVATLPEGGQVGRRAARKRAHACFQAWPAGLEVDAARSRRHGLRQPAKLRDRNYRRRYRTDSRQDKVLRMIMMRTLARRLPKWDASVKLAIALAITLLIMLVALGFGGPQPVQFPARIGAFGLLVTLQILFLWANRREISPYHQAQKHFIAGDYQAARSILEAIPESSRVSVDALVLLGNCYRHLGNYENSRRALEQALRAKPEHHLALFSRGKLSLVQGEYAHASELLAKALAAGSPEIVRFELGQAYYLLGDYERALPQFHFVAAYVEDDSQLMLMLTHYLHVLGGSEPPSEKLTLAGIDHWCQEALRHATTPYGEAIRRAVKNLEDGAAGN